MAFGLTEGEMQTLKKEMREIYPLMKATPAPEILAHYGHGDISNETWFLIPNHIVARKTLSLDCGIGIQGRKCLLVDYDPDYFCFLSREFPWE